MRRHGLNIETASLKEQRPLTAFAERVKTQWIRLIILVFIPYSLLLIPGCGAKKKIVSPDKPTEPSWHTCLIQGAQGTVITDDERISASMTMQTVHDSMLVISIMPLLGMEMLRVEATPTELIAIDKFHGQYATATYAEINHKLTPDLNWDILQQLCAAELPTGSEKARLVYQFGNETIEIVVNCTPRKIDVPVRVNHIKLDKYTKVDITKWL